MTTVSANVYVGQKQILSLDNLDLVGKQIVTLAESLKANQTVLN